jgi:broad specificity phosphatase PhoE
VMLDGQLPVIYIARHGETAWTITGQHTGLTDLPLTPQGERNARALAARLAGIPSGRCSLVLCSARAKRAHWLDLDQSPNSITIWSSGIMAHMYAAE